MTSLPALQGLLERMESQAGRVVARELAAALDDSEDIPIDEVGRERLRSRGETMDIHFFPVGFASCICFRFCILRIEFSL